MDILKFTRRRYIPPYGNLLYLPMRELYISPGGTYKSKDSYSRTVTVTGSYITGKGAFLDGVDDLHNTGSDFIGTSACTIMGWIYPTGWGEGGEGRIIDNGRFIFYAINAKLVATSEVVTFATSAVGSLSLNICQHVAVTRTSTGVANFLINGVISGNTNQNTDADGTLVGGITNVFVGNKADGSRTFAGTIDDLLVFSRVLSVQEIQAHYLATKGWH